MTFRTTFRETLSSQQIALIDLPCTKNVRRIFAIVSTISIPTSASIIMEASVNPQPRGPDWMPITPKTGSLFHAETHAEHQRPKFGDRRTHDAARRLCRQSARPQAHRRGVRLDQDGGQAGEDEVPWSRPRRVAFTFAAAAYNLVRLPKASSVKLTTTGSSSTQANSGVSSSGSLRIGWKKRFACALHGDALATRPATSTVSDETR